MGFCVDNFPNVNVELYDQLDDAAIDVATEFEQRLDELGLSIPDTILESIYNYLLSAAMNTVEDDDA